MEFAGVGVATATNQTTVNLRNAAHLRAISSNQKVERKAELEVVSVTLGEVARREEESARSSQSSRRQ